MHGNRFVLHLVFRSLGNYESATPEDFEEIKKRIPELALRHLARRKDSDEDLVSDFCEELGVANSRDAHRAAKRMVILALPMRIPSRRKLEVRLQSICISRRQIQTASNKRQEASLSIGCSRPGEYR